MLTGIFAASSAFAFFTIATIGDGSVKFNLCELLSGTLLFAIGGGIAGYITGFMVGI